MTEYLPGDIVTIKDWIYSKTSYYGSIDAKTNEFIDDDYKSYKIVECLAIVLSSRQVKFSRLDGEIIEYFVLTDDGICGWVNFQCE